MSRQGLEAVKTIEQEGYKAHIYYDDDPQSPKDWDQLGTLVTWHRNYRFDKDGPKTFGEPSQFLEAAEADGLVYLPVGMHDHSGISLYVGSHSVDYGGWDSGQVGFIYTDKKRYKEICGEPKDGWEEDAKKCLAGEVEVWNQYVSGDIYQVTIEGPDGEVLESCGGFYGIETAKSEAQEMLSNEIKHQRKEAEKISRMMAL